MGSWKGSIKVFTILIILSVFQVALGKECDLNVLVIGAGSAGLGAAQELMYKGCNVKVIEAQNRKGGRIHTIDLGDNKVDLGASWIHGIGPGAGPLKRWKGIISPIYNIAQIYGIKTVPTWKNEDYAEESFYWYKSPNTTLDPEVVLDMNDEIEDWVDEEQDSAKVSDSLADLMKGFDYGSTTDSKLIFDFCMNYLYSQDNAAESYELSGRYFNDYEQFDGSELILPLGYSQIIDILSKDIEIIYEKVVNEIEYSNGKVNVSTKDGTTYTADKVIVTVPLGVLQSGSINFNPPLSQSKTQAIQRLGYGTMDKLWLEFEEAFWTNDKNMDWINYVSDNPGVFVQTLNVDKYFKKPLIVMFNVGDAAMQYSELTDQEVLENAMSIIRKWYPNAPDYLRYARTNWSKDEFAQGSYSYIKVGGSTSDCDAYSEFESTQGLVFFAGEATTCDLLGTVTGAYISGVDAANFAIYGSSYKQDGFKDRYYQEESSSSAGYMNVVVGFLVSFWAI